ncbi:AraC family transcriptional regulator [Kordia sp. YSTF-M3]|uniref:AraC family transcriptional regulator n=1 Tax=Kordia aestuariivivens TaxID=2759037 RepID=A0ABR7Q9Z5_9FLAO|nr:AraC family transcriptional regulator [Kordia aestuariivivens]MBC8755243.1 AraC family transcriptional regulator [Kordia aestuariivivens]
MIFETHKLEGVLHQYVESIFHFKDFMPDHSIERVVPTGHIFIIFELDGFTRNTFDNETLKPNNTFTKVWVSGMHKNYISISAHQKSEMLVIQFKPYGAHPFFHFPIQELNEKVVAAVQLFENKIIELREEILTKKTSKEKFKIVEQWLLDKFHKDKIPSVELLGILEKLQTESVANYGKIIDSYSKTQKHLIDQFKKYIGLTPKYYQRILRFNEILQQIHQSEKIEWSQVAYQCEYADQSHFIKEFKHFSGLNPQKFIKQNFHKDEPNFFPLDRKG